MHVLISLLNRCKAQLVSQPAGLDADTYGGCSHPPFVSRFRVFASWFLTHRFALILFALLVLVGVWILDDYGVALDTGVQRDIAIRNLDYVLGRRDDLVLGAAKDVFKFYGVAFELPLLLLERALRLDDTRDVHLMRHLVTHLFFLVSGFFCYLLAYRLFGNRLLAVLAMLIFLLHPRIYAHSFFNSKDIPFLSMFMVCLYLTYWAFMKGGAWRFLALGVASGILMNLRIMGVTLFVLIVCMQVLNMLQVSSAGDRRRVLGSILVFVLSCAVTLYVVSPYLWGDPFGNSIEWFAVFSQHPASVYQLFRGVAFWSGDVHPPEYVPTWFSITTPPVVLALGVAGILIVFLRGLMSPRDVLGNTRLRFCFMLTGCFMVPIVASIALSSNIYNDWRQMYFLYAPLCLLAVFGLHRLMLVLPRRLRMLIHSAVGAGIVAFIVAMVAIHPHEYIYFNFMVDRTTPEHLRMRYDMDYWYISFREGYEHLLERFPSASLHVRLLNAPSVKLNWEILPEEDRERLIVQGERLDFYSASYKLGTPSEITSRDVTSPLVYSRVIYNSTVLGVAAVDLSLVDDDVAARYIEMYRVVVSGKPVASSVWDVYVGNGVLVYIKESCVPGDYGAPFFLHVTPDDIDKLPEYRRRDGHSTRNFDFRFDRYGVIFDGRCMAVVPIPDDGITGIRTGQWTSDGELWEVAINMRPLGESAYRDEYESVALDNPVINSEFKVYLHDGRLVYVREPCDASDVDAEFFLHVVPSDVDDLPPPRRESGFDNLDFVFETHGLMFDGMCVASVGLPDYDIERIRTGQWDSEQQRDIWKEEFSLAGG